MTDDQPSQTVDYMPTVRNVLMTQGLTFTNAFTTTPLCCPSRVSVLSGEYAHNHGVYTDRAPLGGATRYDDRDSFIIGLHDAGYRTGYFGKYLNEYENLAPRGYVPPDWDEWGVFLDKNLLASEDAGSTQFYRRFSLSENGQPVEYRSKANFSADVLTRKAVDFIAASRNQPFFLTVGYYNPHSPYICADRHKDTFRDPAQWIPWRPPSFNEQDISDKPAYMQQIKPFSPEEIDITYKQILRSLLSVDDGVASILNTLDASGLSRKTIIVYMTDNGLTAGDHRFGFTKNCPYEACIRTPFIVYAPGLFTPRTDASLVANIDLAPTFAELAGVAIPANVDGASLVPLLKDPGSSWRDEILLEHWPAEEGVGSLIPEYHAIRTGRWKYVEYSTGEEELYDLQADPYELRNLASLARYADTITELAGRLALLKQQ
jgi:arylsulfatase A-like enzyme